MLCGKSANLLNIVARIPKRGYTPRQIIILELFVNNKTGKTVSEFKVQLIKVRNRPNFQFRSNFQSILLNIFVVIVFFLAN